MNCHHLIPIIFLSILLILIYAFIYGPIIVNNYRIYSPSPEKELEMKNEDWKWIWKKELGGNDEEDITDLGELKVEEINQRIWTSIVEERQQQQEQGQTAKLDCPLIISGEDKNYTDLMAKQRVTYKDPMNLSMECAEIRRRNHILEKPLSIEEAKFPFAYARNVFQDYRFVEAEFVTNYHPQNWYCFAVDRKADPIFQERIHQLAKCFKNVIIPIREFSIDSSGHSMAKAFMSCLTELAKSERKWQYVFVLQNHDVQVKTNQEMVQIFNWLGGANDIQFEFEHTGPQGMIRKLHQKFDWTFQGLQIFKNDSLNNRTDVNGNSLRLRLAKGQVQSSLVRSFVDFIVHQLNLTKLMDNLDSWGYGADELFFQTIGSANHLNAPGGFTHKCYDQRINVPHITRYTVWNYCANCWENVGKCYSNIFRHSICLFGLEDLSMNLRDSRHLFVNKMMPSADFGAILCWHEEMRRRSMTLEGRRFQRLDPSVYSNWPQTRYLKIMANKTEFKNGSQIGDNDEFQCATENVKYDPFKIFRT